MRASFGLATIYIALALNQSTPGKQENDRRIITIEKDGSKVAKAMEIWTEGKDVESQWMLGKVICSKSWRRRLSLQ